MKIILSIQLALLIAGLSTGCLFSEAADDTQKTAAMRKVSVSLDSLNVEFDFPAGFNSSNGKSFDELAAEDGQTYKNLSNYTIRFNQYMTADNTSKGAKDAKFDGMETDMIFSDFGDMPVTNNIDGFEINKDDKKKVQGEADINLKTHKQVGKYIIIQSIDGNSLKTSLKTRLYYKIGGQSGHFSPPTVKKNIPTRLSESQKAFLSQLIASGLLDE